MTKKLREIVEAKITNIKPMNSNIRTMSNFVGKHVESSKITHDGLRKKFIETFGQEAHDKHFDKLISKHVD